MDFDRKMVQIWYISCGSIVLTFTSEFTLSFACASELQDRSVKLWEPLVKKNIKLTKKIPNILSKINLQFPRFFFKLYTSKSSKFFFRFQVVHKIFFLLDCVWECNDRDGKRGKVTVFEGFSRFLKKFQFWWWGEPNLFAWGKSDAENEKVPPERRTRSFIRKSTKTAELQNEWTIIGAIYQDDPSDKDKIYFVVLLSWSPC